MTFAGQACGSGMNASPEVGLPYNKNSSDVADWCYMPTRVLLESFAYVLQDGQLPVYKKGFFGTCDPKADRARMSLGEKFNEDKIVFLELLPEFCTIQMLKLPLPTKDEVTSSLLEYTETKKVTVWLCFATQILLDVHHIMRHSTKKNALSVLRMSGLRIRKTIEDFWKLSESHPSPKFWPKEGDDEIKRIHDTVEAWIAFDPLAEVRQKARSLVAHRNQLPEQHKVFHNMEFSVA